jgi:predicted negative regulator of RcsB-dependent stress response
MFHSSCPDWISASYIETLKFLDEIQLELWAERRAELKGDVTMCICAAISTSFGYDANAADIVRPASDRQSESIGTCL